MRSNSLIKISATVVVLGWMHGLLSLRFPQKICIIIDHTNIAYVFLRTAWTWSPQVGNKSTCLNVPPMALLPLIA